MLAFTSPEKLNVSPNNLFFVAKLKRNEEGKLCTSQAKAYLVPLDETTEIHDKTVIIKLISLNTSEYILLFKTTLGTLPLHISGKKNKKTHFLLNLCGKLLSCSTQLQSEPTTEMSKIHFTTLT